eukprot:5739557-Karenia_brevis.AAC.1
MENRAKIFPILTFSMSFLFWRLGKPYGCSFDLNGGGPGLLSRALEKLEHGVAIWTAQIKFNLTAVLISCCILLRVRSISV